MYILPNNWIPFSARCQNIFNPFPSPHPPIYLEDIEKGFVVRPNGVEGGGELNILANNHKTYKENIYVKKVVFISIFIFFILIIFLKNQ